MKTWNYLTLNETSEISEDWVWERLRYRRNLLLGASDMKMVSDAPWDLSPWFTYRQALRDLPANVKDPRNVQWPVSPDGYKVPEYVEPVPVIEEEVIEEEVIYYEETEDGLTTEEIVEDEADSL
jgi:hypothetical protein